MSHSGAMINTVTMPMELIFKLSEHEQGCLIRAIESAIEVRQQDHFHAWMRGPFRALLSHESVVCLQIDDSGDAIYVDCLHHNLIEAATQDFLCHPKHGLAVRLAQSVRGKSPMSCMVDANAIDVLLEKMSSERPAESPPLHNAIIHRTNFLSGAAYCFVLFNVSESPLRRSHHLFKLLSSHLKMALARAIAPEGRQRATPLTERELEILRWMREGKSNREISGILGINAMTLKNHISKLYRKLDVQNRAEAVSKGLSVPALLPCNLD